ncbi:hypothetical protein OIU78_030075 [Salix suchowensis]|nr:hypothetical protein OIU78_030075 [Salix suchowensis]
MVKYSREPDNQTKSCKARGSDLRVHFKVCCMLYITSMSWMWDLMWCR